MVRVFLFELTKIGPHISIFAIAVGDEMAIKKAGDIFSSITKIICVLILILVDYCVVVIVFSGQKLVSELHYPFSLFVCAWFVENGTRVMTQISGHFSDNDRDDCGVESGHKLYLWFLHHLVQIL